MGTPKVTALCLVKNEQRWIWYTLMSVIDYVDEIMVWDSGSEDKTVQVISSIKSKKIKFRQLRLTTPADITMARQEMLVQLRGDWLMILDGDEIWPTTAITESIHAIQKTNNTYNFLISRFKNLIGDVYHYQEEEAGQYRIGGYKGHLTIRFVNLHINHDLHFSGDYPLEGLYDSSNQLLQNKFTSEPVVDTPYLHTTHLRRQKFKYELGLQLLDNFEFPKCFYQPHPPIVPSPWVKRSWGYVINAAWQTPLKLIKRRL